MQLQALLLISAQETCNQAKVNSKSHYQWKRMIWCAQNAVRPATHWAMVQCFRSPECFLFSPFLPKIAWNITASQLLGDKNIKQKHLRPPTSSFNNSTFKFCFKHKLLMLYHLVWQETGHPVTHLFCVSTKKARFYLHPHHPKWHPRWLHNQLT